MEHPSSLKDLINMYEKLARTCLDTRLPHHQEESVLDFNEIPFYKERRILELVSKHIERVNDYSRSISEFSLLYMNFESATYSQARIDKREHMIILNDIMQKLRLFCFKDLSMLVNGRHRENEDQLEQEGLLVIKELVELDEYWENVVRDELVNWIDRNEDSLDQKDAMLMGEIRESMSRIKVTKKRANLEDVKISDEIMAQINSGVDRHLAQILNISKRIDFAQESDYKVIEYRKEVKDFLRDVTNVCDESRDDEELDVNFTEGRCVVLDKGQVRLKYDSDIIKDILTEVFALKSTDNQKNRESENISYILLNKLEY